MRIFNHEMSTYGSQKNDDSLLILKTKAMLPILQEVDQIHFTLLNALYRYLKHTDLFPVCSMHLQKNYQSSTYLLTTLLDTY